MEKDLTIERIISLQKHFFLHFLKTIMKNSLLTFLFLSFLATGYCQEKDTTSKLNLDFEYLKKGFPEGWIKYAHDDYVVGVDSSIKKSGKYSVSIASKVEQPQYALIGFDIPDNYPGKIITLSGYIKTENVTGGYAGIWMRIDPSIALDNMHEHGITGTTDWRKYEISLMMNPKETKQIVIGGILFGKGKMWLDDLHVTIDSKDIGEVTPIPKAIHPAEADTAFNKGSQIDTILTGKKEIENLKTLGLVWGFLKYYHPNIAKGNFNWDYELFRILPKVLKSKNTKTTDKLFVDWIKRLGKFEEGKDSIKVSSAIKLMPDLDWITHSHFSKELTDLLLKVKNAKRSRENYYIGLTPGVNNPSFKNENPYTTRPYPDAGFRLLCLYRYWNIVQYYFPYRYAIGEDWKNVLTEFIPKIIHVSNVTEYTLATLELIGRIHDTHANIWGNNEVLNKYFGTKYADVQLKFIEQKPVVTDYFDTSLSKETGMDIGDIITKINVKSIQNIIDEQLKYTPASNYTTQLRDLAKKLLRSNDSTIDITFLRNGTSHNATLKTYALDARLLYEKSFETPDTCFKMIGDDIAYINNGSLKQKYLPELWEHFKNTKGLIIDDRNYPSDFPIYAFSKYLMPKPTPFAKFTHASIEDPGFFRFAPPLAVGSNNKDYYKGKVIILINEVTQSSAEFHAMAYRVHPNAIVVGSTTAGADGDICGFLLPGGIYTMFSGNGITYPDGSETQRVGIIPDVEIRPTIKGIKEGRDELMEKAIELINKK